jgi:2-polyprenyl-6-methoxyphenol hydroxylase-like FAD-dependent oxidoreductase
VPARPRTPAANAGSGWNQTEQQAKTAIPTVTGTTVRIACVGAGPAALYFCVLAKLSNPAHDIVVSERRSAQSSYGWTITGHPKFFGELYRHDPNTARAIEQAAQPCRDLSVDIRGHRVSLAGNLHMFNINRPQLVNILADRARQLGVRIQYEEEILNISQLPDADLIVAADGMNSLIRDELGSFGTEIEVTDDKYIWLGSDRKTSTFVYYFAETDFGWIWGASYGVRSELSAFVVHCAPETWAGLGFDAMPMQDSIAALEELFKEQLDGHRLIGQVDARWRSFRNVSNRRWHDGNIVLMGDSAHTTHFSIGQGTTLALKDAIALADNLDRHNILEEALQGYERQRQRDTKLAQNKARLSAQWFTSMPRYVDLEPGEFGALLMCARSSRLLPLLPPRLYYLMRQLYERAPLVKTIHD